MPVPKEPHYYGDGCRFGHINGQKLADFILERGWSDLPDEDLTLDIEENPKLYVPEQEAMDAAHSLAETA